MRRERAADHGTHQLVGVQVALHQRAHRALHGELDGARRRRTRVRLVLDRHAVERQAGSLGHRFETRARPDEHRLDEPGAARIERRRQADRVGRMDDRHLDWTERPHELQQAHEVVALRDRDAHLRQGAARALDARGRGGHDGLAGDHGLSALVHAGAVQRHQALALVARGDLHGRRQRVAGTDRRAEA
jgi:hypothetical protein